MPLTLVLGPANSAKAGEVLGAYTLAARRDALLVVPTAADAAHYDRELAATGVTLGRSLTFSGLIEEIATRAGHERQRLTQLQRDRVLRRAIAALELPSLSDSARAPGFATAAGALFAELRLARVSPPRFTTALRAWADPGGAPGPEGRTRAPYAADLAALYSRYAHELERLGRLDAESHAWAALDALRGDPHRWNATPVFFYGFDDLTRLERDTVETLSRAAGAAITVSLTYEPGRPALAARATIVEELRTQAANVRELPALDEYYEPDSRSALHHLERDLFEPGAPEHDPGDAVQLMEAGGERAEAELVAAEVVAAVRDGVPAQEIVIVCRSLRRSGALLEQTLSRYGIASTSARRIPVGHTALGRALLGLARCALLPSDRATAADLLAYLRAPGVHDDRAAIDRLDAELRRRAVTGAAEARRLAGGLPVQPIDRLRRADGPAAVLAEQARGLLDAANPRSAAILTAAEVLDARAVAVVLRALDEAAALGRLAPAELIELLEGLEVPAGGDPGPDAVLVAEPLAIRARRFRRVLVTGLCEGEFPSASDGAADPFLGEDRRRELALASGLVLAADDDPLARERYLLYACVSRATERVSFSYRSADEEGNLVTASPFLEDLAELFGAGWRARRRRRLLADVVWSASEAPTAREHRLALAATAARPPAEPATTRHLGEDALGHVRHREVVSAGALESFASCPVKWLIERQLEPQELEPTAEPLVRGNFMHDVLERVIASLGAPLSAATLAAAEQELDGLTAPEELAPGRPAAVRAAVLRGIEADLRRYLRHEASDGNDWVPRWFELEFDVELGAGADVTTLRGFIDRIDLEPGGGRRAIVRDYKSGANRAERASGRWLADSQLQVGLYMLAVRRLLELEPVAGFYQPLTGKELRPRGAYVNGTAVGRHAYPTDALDSEDLAQLLAEIEARALELAATLRRGELTPCPETCSRDGCRHPGICWSA